MGCGEVPHGEVIGFKVMRVWGEGTCKEAVEADVESS